MSERLLNTNPLIDFDFFISRITNNAESKTKTGSPVVDFCKIDSVIKEKYGDTCKTIDFVLISHIHLDHMGYIGAEEDENDNLLDENGQS
ncbi:MAG: hypothetical protein QNK11_08410, partial [Legionella sp.]|nr:hypothetical protein [Legionella sp.]